MKPVSRSRLLLLAAAAALVFAGAARTAAPAPVTALREPSDVLFAQDSPAADPNTDASQKFTESADAFAAEYQFENFNRDRLKLKFSAKKGDVKDYESRWGYQAADLAGLKTWLAKARQAAFQEANAKGRSQAQLDAALAGLQTQYREKLTDYLSSRFFRLAADNSVRVDMPAVVRANAPLVKSLAHDLDQYSKMKRYDSEDTVGAAAAMVQTAMLYRIPPAVDGDRHTGGLIPPVSALLKGWGDCDSKSAVLASLLTNYSTMHMVGISIPEHYLVGVLGIPHQGQVFVEYQGLQYVLIEPAGPAWLPPGSITETTSARLGVADSYKIEPFF